MTGLPRILMSRARTALVLTATAGLLAAGPVAAVGGGWSRPATLGAPNHSWEAAVAADPRGDAVAVWVEDATTPYRVMAATRDAGKLRFGAPTVLSDATADNPYYPTVSMDRFGDAFVVWYDNGFAEAAVFDAATRTWLPTEQIGAAQPLALAVTPSGNVTVLFGGGGSVTVVNRPRGGPWGPLQTIATAAHLVPASLAMAKNGAAIVSYETFRPASDPDYGTDFVVHAMRRASFAGRWSKGMVLTPPLATRYGHSTTVGIDSAGDAVVVGRQLDGGTSTLTLQVMTQPAAGGDWAGPVTLSKPATSSGLPSMGVTPKGDVTIVWGGSTAAQSVAEVVTGVLPGGSWTGPTDLSAPGDWVGYPLVSLNNAGDAVASWTSVDRGSGQPTQVRVSRRSGPVGAWTQPLTLGSATAVSNAIVGVDDAGGAVAVWNESVKDWFGMRTLTSTYRP